MAQLHCKSEGFFCKADMASSKSQKSLGFPEKFLEFHIGLPLLNLSLLALFMPSGTALAAYGFQAQHHFNIVCNPKFKKITA